MHLHDTTGASTHDTIAVRYNNVELAGKHRDAAVWHYSNVFPQYSACYGDVAAKNSHAPLAWCNTGCYCAVI